jgi:hypothetical protein
MSAVTPSAGGAEYPISLAPGTEEAGLAIMLADLIRFNLAEDPRKWTDFNRLDRLFEIEARDAAVTVTLEFNRGSLVVHGGRFGSPRVRISANSKTVLELARIRIVHGIPNLFDSTGRDLLKKTLSGSVRIAGALGNLIALVRVTRLMSVSDGKMR